MIEINGKEIGDLSELSSEKIKSDLLTLNMGPQHPATHGVLRVEIKTDSEVVADCYSTHRLSSPLYGKA
jgi:NADH:ubiquinone oxidoreductase subunit D